MKKIGIGWCLIPPQILSRKDLSQSQKLLIGRILGLVNEDGYCYASNAWLGEQIGLCKNRVSIAITELQQKNLVRIEIVKDENNRVKERRIYPLIEFQSTPPVVENDNTPISENGDTPISENGDTPISENGDTPISENGEVLIRKRNRDKRNRDKRVAGYEPASFPYKLSLLLFTEILRNNPNSRLHQLTAPEKENKLQRWAKDIDLLLQKDKKPPELIEKVIKISTSNDFWRGNILSGTKLREKWDTLVLLGRKEGDDDRFGFQRRDFKAGGGVQAATSKREDP